MIIINLFLLCRDLILSEFFLWRFIDLHSNVWLLIFPFESLFELMWQLDPGVSCDTFLLSFSVYLVLSELILTYL
ncbi:hypothetical protein RJT34_31453 [Clitoria ternatea]|uniref:Uncharacterized protein n=1 Tax=Clitoria ternatea TaxID=43366 RepID=A0AAN9EV27_CLITE